MDHDSYEYVLVRKDECGLHPPSVGYYEDSIQVALQTGATLARAGAHLLSSVVKSVQETSEMLLQDLIDLSVAHMHAHGRGVYSDCY